ncbi:ATP-binding protein [Arabiibacter massiliensis]|uniref:ATP-binding protein n=1 Tax=Arabiibacter massiliensis TaxID=1870985 RepID=UPI0009BB49BB|nr:ATP-binding protein [Arabiibacter massiliensis]
MGNWVRRLVRLALAAALAAGAAPVCALADEGPAPAEAPAGRVLTVAFPPTPGISALDESGVRSGIFYDWLVEIAKYTGWTYEFVDGDVEELMDRVASGEIDLMGGMYLREQLADSYGYARMPIGSNHAFLVCPEDRDDLVSYDVRSLDGASIGVYEKAVEKNRRLQNFIDFNGLDCRIVPLGLDSYESCLADGLVDVKLGSEVGVPEGCKVVAEFENEPYYIVSAAGSDLVAEVDAAMEQVFAADPAFADELYRAYYPEARWSPLSLTKDDRAFVEASGSVTVAVVADRYPLYYERDGSCQGIVKDVFDRIAELTGLSFRFVHAATYEEAIGLVASGGADLLGGFMDDAHAAAERGLALTKGFASLDEVVLRNKLTLGDGREQVFAQIEGRVAGEAAEGARVERFASYAECLEAVNQGRADFTSMPASYAERLFMDRSFSNVTPATSDHRETSFTVAFPQPVDAGLYAVMSKAINSLTQEELDSALSRNAVPMGDRPVSLRSLIVENPLVAAGVVLVVALLVAAVAIVVSVSKVRNRMMEIRLEKAEETGRAKADFLSRMSHEIRTPMNAIIGLSNVASLSGEATPAIRASLEKINTSAQFLLALVNDILDMSKIENDKMRIEPAPMSPRSLAERLQSMFGLLAEEKGLALEVRCDVEGLVEADDVRLQQVLANLLTNAFKFTDAGGAVQLTLHETARAGGAASIRFGVKDDGAGIKEEDLERIFVSFEQAAENRRNAQGTGLGLAISSNLVRLMGGRLEVSSRWGEGSEFFFTLRLPVAGGEGPEGKGGSLAEEAPARTLSGTRALVAEDNDLNAEIAQALLEMEGVASDRAADGREAVELFAASEPGAYDFVLMDVKMPVLDGLAAAGEIRALPRADARAVPIVALTANTFQEDRDKAAAAGMDAFVPKPFDARQLYDTLEGLLGRQG